jgi:hypothetical protein
MAGYSQGFASAIIVGIGSAAATIADTSLQFEVARVGVDLASVDYANNAVVFKGQLSSEVECIIYETGIRTLLNSGNQFDSQMLLNFSDSDLTSAGTYVATNSRLGSALQLTAAASTTTTSNISNIFYDLSGYSATDQFTLVYRANNAFVSNISMRFKTDASNYYTVSLGAGVNGVYTLTTFNKSVPVATGAPDWANITSIDVMITATAGGTASVDFDGLRIEDRDSFREEDVLVSRSVLATPVVKASGFPLDVEYRITL